MNFETINDIPTDLKGFLEFDEGTTNLFEHDNKWFVLEADIDGRILQNNQFNTMQEAFSYLLESLKESLKQ